MTRADTLLGTPSPDAKRRAAMAFRKKPVSDKDVNSDVEKLKSEIQVNTKEAIEAAAKVIGTPVFAPSPLEAKWRDMQAQVNKLSEDIANGSVEVRVLQYGPDGRLTDVSDKVRPSDLRMEQIKAFDSSDGSVAIPRLPNGEVDKEAAKELLAKLVGIQSQQRLRPVADPKLQEMEVLLKETDKILSHWRR